jgi:hypothetical protein
MHIGLLFWILMIIWAFFDARSNWPVNGGYGPIGSRLLLFVLLFLLGWNCFGFVVHN